MGGGGRFYFFVFWGASEVCKQMLLVTLEEDKEESNLICISSGLGQHNGGNCTKANCFSALIAFDLLKSRKTHLRKGEPEELLMGHCGLVAERIANKITCIHSKVEAGWSIQRGAEGDILRYYLEKI